MAHNQAGGLSRGHRCVACRLNWKVCRTGRVGLDGGPLARLRGLIACRTPHNPLPSRVPAPRSLATVCARAEEARPPTSARGMLVYAVGPTTWPLCLSSSGALEVSSSGPWVYCLLMAVDAAHTRGPIQTNQASPQDMQRNSSTAPRASGFGSSSLIPPRADRRRRRDL